VYMEEKTFSGGGRSRVGFPSFAVADKEENQRGEGTLIHQESAGQKKRAFSVRVSFRGRQRKGRVGGGSP